MDQLDITILADGTIKVVVNGNISEANHFNADQFIAFCAQAMGGTHEIEHKQHEALTHEHAHDHLHTGMA